MKNEEIFPLLHQLGSVTFFSRDLGFYNYRYCHESYCLVCLDVGQYEAASFIKRFLKYPAFNTKAKRLGKVVCVGHREIRIWQLNIHKEDKLTWQS